MFNTLLATVIFSTWYLATQVNIYCCTRYLHRHSMFTRTLGMLHLIYDLWHRHSVFTPALDICNLSHGTWYLDTGIDICHTWHLILTRGIQHMITVTWHAFMWYKYIDLTSWPLTGHYHPWYLYYMAYSWLSLLRGLGMIIILLPDIWYSWTPVLLNSCILEPLK